MLAPHGSSAYLSAHVGVGVDRNRRDVQLAAHRAFVQRLDVLEPMLETVTAQVDLVLRHRVKHERVVRIGRMSEREDRVILRHRRN